MTSIAVAPIAVVKVKGEFVQKQHNIKKSLLKEIKNKTKQNKNKNYLVFWRININVKF